MRAALCIWELNYEFKRIFTEYQEVASIFRRRDSAYLLYVAKSMQKVCAYYVKSHFQPQFELDDAIKLAKQLDAEVKIINLDILSVPSLKKTLK